MATVDDLAALAPALQEIKPTVLYSVPTLYKRVYDGIQAKVRPRSWVGRGGQGEGGREKRRRMRRR